MATRLKKTPAQLEHDIHTALKLEPPRLKRLGYVTGLAVYLVSGEHVRNHIDPDFTQGGNEGAYPGYNPPGEIWIDDAMHVLDRIATIFHEIVERNLMMCQGVGYDKAHDTALEREMKFRKELMRQRPTSTDLRLVTKALRPYAQEASPSGKKPGRASRTISG
jgi:hypothetical protein